MNVLLNGSPADLDDGATVADAVAAAGVGEESRGVAVAVEGEIIPRGDWRGRELRDGESVEVVHAVQGG